MPARKDRVETTRVSRILVVDDHSVVRRGIRSVLGKRKSYSICGEAANGDEAIAQAKRLRPDIVVMDVTLGQTSGFQATRQILEALPQTRILILTMHESEQVVREVLKAGAHGYVLKSDADTQLSAGIEALAHGGTFFNSKIARMVTENYLGRRPRPDTAQLTPRQREVLLALAAGQSNKQVADALGISQRTVETHRQAIMKRLAFNSFSDMVRFAVRERIIEP